MPVVVTDQSFKSEVLDAELPVLVDFWAAWCGPCRMVAPILEEISREYAGRLRVAKVDVDENPRTAQAYGVVSIPTLNLYKGGELIKSIVGARPKKALIAEIEPFLA